MSESLHAGYLPIWNPYINYGIPQYGDMSGGAWNPITWLVASTIGYSAWTFTIEILLYILLSGIGMYLLLRKFSSIKKVALIGAMAYMCCGYQVGHLQHVNWLSGAAFLPWCLWAYDRIWEKLSLRNSLVAATCFYFLFSSAHPGISIAAIYFFLSLALFYFFRDKDFTITKRAGNFLKLHGAILLPLLLLSMAMLIGYADFMPHFNRGEKIDLESALLLPTTFQSWISVVIPLATVKNPDFFATDISMRNIYFSITLLFFFLCFLQERKTALQKFFLATGIIFLLLSTGGIFKEFAYHFLPLLGYVRLNGEFRIFSIICFIIPAAIELHQYMKGEREPGKGFFPGQFIYYKSSWY